MSEDYLEAYMSVMPVSMALWRAAEATLYTQIGLNLTRPILDLGCGDGIFASVLFKERIDAAIDLSPSEVSKARTLGVYCDLKVANAIDIPWNDNSFGTVISNCVIEHIPYVDKVLLEVYRVLKEKGKFIFTVPSEYYGQYLCGNLLLSKLRLKRLAPLYVRKINEIGKQLHCYSPKVWDEKLLRVGLKLQDYRYYMPEPAMHLYDLFGIFRPLMTINLFLFKKRVIFSRKWITLVLGKTLTRYIELTPETGGGLMLIAQKMS